MGWFDEQIRQRKQNDNDVFADAFADIASAVIGKKAAAALSDNSRITRDAIDEILKFYHIRPVEIPDSIKAMDAQLEFLMRPSGIMRRNVKLTGEWYKDAVGAMLGIRKSDGSAVAFIPHGFSGYTYYDSESGKRIKLSRKNSQLFEEEAIAFYKPFPLKKMGMGDLVKYIGTTLSAADIISVAMASLAAALAGMLMPAINNILFSDVVGEGSMRLLGAAAVFLVCACVSSMIIGSVKALLTARIGAKINISVQAAVMMRVISLPADFFKDYSSGDLSSRSSKICKMCDMLISSVLSVGLTSVFSMVYIAQIFLYAPSLVIPALTVILVTLLITVITAVMHIGHEKEKPELSAKESGMTYALLSGIQKIKLAGAEKRAFARWGSLYSKIVKLEYDPPAFIKLQSVFLMAVSVAGTIVMYYFAAKANISVGDYYAFNTAYGLVSGAFMSLASAALTVAQIKPVWDMARPVLEAVPEISEGKQVIAKLSGSIELNNVSFRYNEDMPLIVDNMSLKIRSGQYVAIVGRTGCGKSTLLRLLLGFETPQKGAVYYDGKDISKIDLRSLRKHIGVVMQNGKLFQGDIYSNIVISAPELTLDDAWEAAELAGIADDIRRMPMGMNTIISEGSGGISGGQRQRLMIARAIAPRPKILMFDEATSALDNLTQKRVSESLDKLKCTRIVIAHRLSTIKQCDRIIVLEKGRIIEDGSFDELMANKGYFSELVARQRLDDTEYVGRTTAF